MKTENLTPEQAALYEAAKGIVAKYPVEVLQDDLILATVALWLVRRYFETVARFWAGRATLSEVGDSKATLDAALDGLLGPASA